MSIAIGNCEGTEYRVRRPFRDGEKPFASGSPREGLASCNLRRHNATRPCQPGREPPLLADILAESVAGARFLADWELTEYGVRLKQWLIREKCHKESSRHSARRIRWSVALI